MLIKLRFPPKLILKFDRLLAGLNFVIQAAKLKGRGYKIIRNFKIITYLIVGCADLIDI